MGGGSETAFCTDNGTVVLKAMLSSAQGFAVHPSSRHPYLSLSSGDEDDDPSWDSATFCSVPLLCSGFLEAAVILGIRWAAAQGTNSRKRQELRVCFQGLVRNPPTLSPPGSARTAAQGLG